MTPQMAPHASTLVTVGVPLLAVLALTGIGIAIQRSSTYGARRMRIFAVGAGAWLALTGGLAYVGFFARFEALPPRMGVVLLPTLLMPLVLGLSRIGRDVATFTPLALLVGFHGFRLPLELVMHRAAREGTMPAQMSFDGWNFDIVTGASALVVAWLVAKGSAPRWLVLTFNALGSLLLFAIVAIALASLPQFRAFGDEPARVNTWVAYFPFVWLPAGLVASALFGHVVLWRRLLGPT